jgi:hypothetical protein
LEYDISCSLLGVDESSNTLFVFQLWWPSKEVLVDSAAISHPCDDWGKDSFPVVSTQTEEPTRGGTSGQSEPEFINIYWRLKSRLFKESCLFKAKSAQQGSQWLQFFLLCLNKQKIR